MFGFENKKCFSTCKWLWLNSCCSGEGFREWFTAMTENSLELTRHICSSILHFIWKNYFCRFLITHTIGGLTTTATQKNWKHTHTWSTHYEKFISLHSAACIYMNRNKPDLHDLLNATTWLSAQNHNGNWVSYYQPICCRTMMLCNELNLH